MSIFKQTFADGIKNQLKVRQDAILNRTPPSIQYYNSRNAWIRMTSAVDVGGDNGALAKKNILLGGTLVNIGQFGYSQKSGIGTTASNAYSTKTSNGVDHRLGIRPMPGITSIDVKSKAAYGSLREVAVNFQCWDIRQLEELELLYMRPGYSVLIEWGWVPYLDNNSNLQSNIKFIEDVLNGSKSKEDIWKDIYSKSTLDGNYDAIYGFIKNYSWSARPDGGYDCSTTIITMGEVIESLKVNYGAFDVPNITVQGIFGAMSGSSAQFLPTYVTAPGTNIAPTMYVAKDTIREAYSKNIIAGICAELYQIVVDRTSKSSEHISYTDPKDNKTVYQLLRNDISTKGQQDNSNTIVQGTQQIYITLSSFVDILNKYVILSENKNGVKSPIAGLSVKERSSSFGGNESLLQCLADIHQLSTNPTVCLIKNTAYTDPKILQIEGLNTEPLKKYMDVIPSGYDFLNPNTEDIFGTIGNIYVNLDYIYKLSLNDVIASQDKKEKNDILLFDFIKSIMSGINAAIGNVSNFDIFVDPLDSFARIIDVNYTGNRQSDFDNAVIIQTHDLQSVVRNYKLESQIFPDQITTIAIGAQAKGGALGADVNTLIDFNQNLVDRIVPKKESPLSPTSTDPVAELNEKQTNLSKNWGNILNYITELKDSFWSKGDYDVEQSSVYANSLKDIINYFSTFLKTNAKNRAIIPTKLSLELDGIGGVIIGNIFRIPDDILPRGYKGGGAGPKKIGYVVTGIGHSIQNNDWVTRIDAQFIILDEPTGTKLSDLSIVKIQNYNATSGQSAPTSNRPGNNFAPVTAKNVADADSLGLDFTKFLYPTNGKITSDFGNRLPGVPGASSFHEGLDIANVLNTPIYSVCYGTVKVAGNVGGYGDSALYIEIDSNQHPNNSSSPLYVIYGHNQSITVKVGDYVKPGTLIAYMGSKGFSSGPHLHMQIQNGLSGNSLSYIYGRYFPQKGGSITAKLPWGSMK